jgi:hypothetical protein
MSEPMSTTTPRTMRFTTCHRTLDSPTRDITTDPLFLGH